MVTVPTVRDRTVGLQNIPRATTLPTGDIAAFGGGRVAAGPLEAFQQTTQTTTNFAIREALKADEVQDLEARKDLANLENEITWGENGFFRMQGKNAVGGVDKARDAWVKGTAAIEGRLANRRQKEAFRRAASGREPFLIRGAMKHVATQAQNHEDQTLGALLANVDKRISDNWDDLGNVRSSIEEKKIELAKWASRSGLGKEETQRLMTAEVSKSHMLVMNNMLNAGQTLTAKDYFKEFAKGELTPQDKQTVERRFRRGSILGEARRLVGEIMTFEGITDKTDQERRQILRESTDDPDVLSVAESMLENRLRFKNQEESQNLENTYNDAIRQLEQAGGGDPFTVLTTETYDELLQKAPALLGQLKSRFRVRLSTVTDKWFDFFEIVRNDPNRLRLMKRQEFEGFWNKFNETDRKWAERAWLAASSAKTRAEAAEKLTTFVGPIEQMDRFLVRSDLVNELSKDRNVKQRDRVKRWQELVQARVQKWEREHPKLIVDDKVINGIMVDALDDKVAVQGLISDSIVSVAALGEDDRGNITYPEALWRELDEDVRDATKFVLQSNGTGLQITDELARRYYAAVLANNQELATAILEGRER